MKTTEATANIPAYVAEYRDAFVPFTNEDMHGVITDVNTGQVVETPATHPGYRARYGEQATAHAVQTNRSETGERY